MYMWSKSDLIKGTGLSRVYFLSSENIKKIDNCIMSINPPIFQCEYKKWGSIWAICVRVNR
jgi:hypothetical protein